MIIALIAFLVVALVVPTYEQSTPISPCPNVFMYEPPGSEPGRWYGVVNLSTDSTLHSLWLNIVLDSKADILGNWVGDVTTQDNIDFKVENTEMKINPGPAVAVRFFVQYNQLNKAPRLLTIRLNGREICNSNSPKPSIDRPDNNVQIRPEGNRPVTSSARPQYAPPPVKTKSPQEELRPVYVRPVNNPNPASIDGGEDTVQNLGGNSVSKRPNTHPTTKPVFNGDSVSNGRTTESPYYEGGQIIFTIPSGSSNTNTNNRPLQQDQECGKVVLNNPVPLVVNGSPTLEGQWPWHIALYQTQTVDNKYICGGTLASTRHVITAAHCITLKGSRRAVNQNTLTVYLGKHNLRTSVDGVQIRFVENILVHPDYNATIFSRDLAILQLREPVTITDWVRPVCLWPNNQIGLNYVVGKQGSVVGWGYDDTGVATEELILVEMPVVNQETCIRSYSEFFVRFTSEYTFCAGFRNGVYSNRTGRWQSTSVCNGDSGGGMVFKMGNTWYLRGLVSVSVARENEYRCNPSHYVIFTDLAKFSSWIQQNVIDF